MSVRKYLPGIAGLALLPAVLMAADPAELLRKAEMADKYVSYRGTKSAIVYFNGKMANSCMKVVHLKPDKTRTDFFSPAQLAGVILIHDSDSTWKYSPKKRVWESVSSCVKFNSDEICREVLENFNLTLLDSDVVANRPAYVVLAEPRVENGPSRRMWIDKEYFLVLATEVQTNQGSVVNASKFVRIEMNPPDISPSVFQVNGKVEKVKRQCKRFRTILPGYLPKGYKFVGSSSLVVGGRCCAHLRFTNGANTISLFQREYDKEAPMQRINSKVTNVLTWARGGILFTLIGDVPSSEMKKIAQETR